MSRGFILIEASVTYVVLSLALVALVPIFVLTIRAAKGTERVVTAAQLAVELLEEVRLRRWDESTPRPPARIASPGAVGADAGEAPADKRTFDDIDDFNGWTESPPADPLNQPLAGAAGYARSAAVRYVDAALNPAAGTTDFKEVTVCVTGPQLKPVCLATILTNR